VRIQSHPSLTLRVTMREYPAANARVNRSGKIVLAEPVVKAPTTNAVKRRRRSRDASSVQSGSFPEDSLAGPRFRRWWSIALVVGLVGGGLVVAYWPFSRAPAAPDRAEHFTVEVVNTFPHDAKAYCQGLYFYDDHLLESTGGYGDSTLRQVELDTGKTIHSVQLDERLFGEGITVFNDRVYQLTWKSGVCYVYDAKTLKYLHQFRYRGEGWGLTDDGERLIMSNGGSTLYYRDPTTFEVTGQLKVTHRGALIKNLNELEFVSGEIYANIYKKDMIVRISPRDGEVTGWIDLSGLMSRRERAASRAEVLNGIAYDSTTQRLFVTGKNWPKLFEVRLAPKP
jgi:glutamine cyclotransferase